jgi:predicted small secreted protein
MLSLILAITFVSGVSLGCRNTAEGIGDDTKRMGDKIEDATD